MGCLLRYHLYRVCSLHIGFLQDEEGILFDSELGDVNVEPDAHSTPADREAAAKQAAAAATAASGGHSKLLEANSGWYVHLIVSILCCGDLFFPFLKACIPNAAEE